MSMRLAKIECHTTRHGMTLVEMLVATTMTLVIMGCLITLWISHRLAKEKEAADAEPPPQKDLP